MIELPTSQGKNTVTNVSVPSATVVGGNLAERSEDDYHATNVNLASKMTGLDVFTVHRNYDLIMDSLVGDGAHVTANEHSLNDMIAEPAKYQRDFGKDIATWERPMMMTHDGVKVADLNVDEMLADLELPAEEYKSTSDKLREWGGVDIKGATAEEWEPPDNSISGRVSSFIQKRKINLARNLANESDEGRLKWVAQAIDIAPSFYRGFMRFASESTMEEAEASKLHQLMYASGRFKADQDMERMAFLNEVKEFDKVGYVSGRATDAVYNIGTFFATTRLLGLRYGNGASATLSAGKWTKTMNVLTRAQRFAITRAIVSDVPVEEKVQVYVMSAAYASTPAGSQWFEKALLRVPTDFALNSIISSKQYQDIVNDPDLDGLDKWLAASEVFGTDLMFSFMTTGWEGQKDKAMARTFDAGTKAMLDPANITRASMEALNPNNARLQLIPETPTETARGDAVNTGSKFIEIDKADRVSLDAVKQAESHAKKRIAEIDTKPAGEERSASEAQERESLVKMLNVIKKNKGASGEEQLARLKADMIIEKPVVEDTAQKTQAKILDDLAQGKIVSPSDVVDTWGEVAFRELPPEVATKLVGDMTKMVFSGKETNLAETSRKAWQMVSDAIGRDIEKSGLTGAKLLKDLKPDDPKVITTEGKMLRGLFMELQKEGKVARSATIDKVIENQKVAEELIKQMDDASDVKKALVKLRNAQSAKTDPTQEKRMDEFVEFANQMIEKERKAVAEKGFKQSVANLKKTAHTDTGRQFLSDVKDLFDGKPMSDEKRAKLEASKAYFDKSTDEPSNRFQRELDRLAKTNVKDMTADDLTMLTQMVNKVSFEQKRIKEARDRGNRTRAQNAVAKQRKVIVANSEPKESYERNKLLGVPAKVYQTVQAVNGIPRLIAERLDYATHGEFGRIQDRLDIDGGRDHARVLRAKDRIITPALRDIGNLNKLKKTAHTFKSSRDGREKTVKLNWSDRQWFYITSKDPEFVQQYKNGFVFKSGDTPLQLRAEDVNTIINSMSDKERALGDAVLAVYNLSNKSFINERSNSMVGYSVATKEQYGGMRKHDGVSERFDNDGNFVFDPEKGFGDDFSMFLLENQGFLKERTGTKNALLMYNPLKEMDRITEGVAKFYGYSEILGEARAMMRSKAGNDTLQGLYTKAGRDTYFKAYESFINGYGQKTKIDNKTLASVNKTVNWFTDNLRKSALALNHVVGAKQVASLPLANHIPEKYTLNPAVPTRSMNYMKERSDFIWHRYNRGGQSFEVRELQRGNKADPVLFANITAGDALVIGKLWGSAEKWVSDTKPDLTGSDFDKEVERRVIKEIMTSQPDSHESGMPLMNRHSQVALLRPLLMFQSQRNKIHYMRSSAAESVFDKYNSDTLTKKDAGHLAKTVFKTDVLVPLMMGLINTVAKEHRQDVLEVIGVKSKDRVSDMAADDQSAIAGWLEMSDDEFVKAWTREAIASDLGTYGWMSGWALNAIAGYGDDYPITDNIQDTKKTIKDLSELITAIESNEIDEKTGKPIWYEKAGKLSISASRTGGTAAGFNPMRSFEFPMVIWSQFNKGKRKQEWINENADELGKMLEDHYLEQMNRPWWDLSE